MIPKQTIRAKLKQIVLKNKVLADIVKLKSKTIL